MKIEGINKRNKNGGFKVLVEGKLLSPRKSQKICNHSPNGFSWGYEGSGPAQLGLALIIYAAEKLNVPVMETAPYYQDLTRDFVATLPAGSFSVEFDLLAWIKDRLNQKMVS